MRKRYKVLLLLDAILLAFSLFIMGSYQVYLQKEEDHNKKAVVITNGDLSINYLQGERFSYTDPLHMESFSFSVTNTGTETMYYSINILNTTNPYENNITFTMTSTNDGANVTSMELSEKDYTLPDSISIPAGVTQSYTVTFSVKDTSITVVSEAVEGTFMIGREKAKETSFATLLLETNKIGTSKTVVGSEVSTEDEGLLETEDDSGKSYYFRGNVTNNFVSLADQMWRIVRINGDGTIRLILDTTISSASTTFHEEELKEDAKIDGVNYEKSDVKEFLDGWYLENLNDYDDMIAEGSYCIDLEYLDESNEKEFRFMTYERAVTNKKPSLLCKKGSKQYKIGLLSSDEMLFAGSVAGTANKDYYLYNRSINSSWWLISPSKSDMTYYPSMMIVSSDGSIKAGAEVNTSNALRPVINLNSDVLVTGKGTISDPYIPTTKER